MRVERIKGAAPFYAYGVINDQVTADGSFVQPVPANPSSPVDLLTLPVLVETSTFSSELVVTNFSTSPRTLHGTWVAPTLTGGRVSFDISLLRYEQQILPAFVQVLRSRGVVADPPGRSYAGAVFFTDDTGDLRGISIGARTMTPGGGGRYGVFYPAVPAGSEATTTAWLHDLRQDAENRTNLLLVNVGSTDASADTFRIDIFAGANGAKSATLDDVTLPARGFLQIDSLLRQYAPGVASGYALVTKTSGSNPFLANAVINDGAYPGERSGDGAFIEADLDIHAGPGHPGATDPKERAAKDHPRPNHFILMRAVGVLLVGIYVSFRATGQRWESVPLHCRGFVMSAPVDKSHVYCSNPPSRSDDGARSWIPLDWPAPYTALVSVAPDDARVLYMVDYTPAQSGSPVGGQALWRSMDSGVTWQLRNANLPKTCADGISRCFVGSLLITRGNPDRILLGSSPFCYCRIIMGCFCTAGWGVVRSDDGGLTLADTSFSRTDAVLARSWEDKFLYAFSTTSGGMYVSTDDGHEWVLASRVASMLPTDIVISPENPCLLLLQPSSGAAVQGPGMYTLIRSTDCARTWTPVLTSTPLPSWHAVPWRVIASPWHPGRLLIQDWQPFALRSDDFGSSWKPECLPQGVSLSALVSGDPEEFLFSNFGAMSFVFEPDGPERPGVSVPPCRSVPGVGTERPGALLGAVPASGEQDVHPSS